MKRIIVRDDLMSKSEYSKKYNVSRPTVDTRIKDGSLAVELISGVEYIKVK